MDDWAECAGKQIGMRKAEIMFILETQNQTLNWHFQ